MTKLGLVLSGGGSKGAYEVGAFIALKKLHKKVDIVTGTSIGAINGMFIAQRDLRGALRLWNSISFKKLYDENEFTVLEDDKLSKIYAEYAKGFINDGGLDIYKMKVIFDKMFKPKRFFSSGINYGIVTYNLSKYRPVIKMKKDLTKDNLKDYVLASASCYPAFRPYPIDGDLYIDGGYYDNIPINLAIDMGADEVIAIDLRAVGFKKNIKDKSVLVTYIAPRNNIGSFLVFDKNQARKSIKFGYNDTMKTFGKLDGNKFTFKKHNLIRNYNKYIDKFDENLHSIFSSDNKILNKLFSIDVFKEMINGKTYYNSFNDIVENAGKIFGFEEFNIYNIKSYNRGLLSALSNTEAINVNNIISKVKNKEVSNLIDRAGIVKYFYNSIKDGRVDYKYIPFLSREFLVALYLYSIKNSRSVY